MAAKKNPEPTNLFDVIYSLKLEKKLIDISLAKAGVPRHLHDDVAQEIRIAWLNATADPTVSEGETASYAHTIGFHTALRVRRDFGGPVRLPGSAFRKRADGSTYVQPGHLAAPLQWEELAETIVSEETEAFVRDENAPWAEVSGHLADDHCGDLALSSLETELREKLSKRQRKILALLVKGASFSRIEHLLNIQHNTLQRNLRQIRKKMNGE